MSKQVNKISPNRFVPQLVGGLAGGFGGFLKARNEAKAEGRKVTFKDAWDDVLIGGAKGVINPAAGAMGAIGHGTSAVAQQEELATNPVPIIQGQAPADQALTLAQGQNPITYKNNSIGKPHQAAMMLGISNGLMPKGAMLG